MFDEHVMQNFGKSTKIKSNIQNENKVIETDFQMHISAKKK